jgi:hypothetical protein
LRLLSGFYGFWKRRAFFRLSAEGDAEHLARQRASVRVSLAIISEA